jgi:hypothetical protein
MAHRRQLRGELFHQRQEVQVEEQHLVLRVVGNPGDLLGKEPRVDGVAHQLGLRAAVVDLQMPVAVPGQGGDAVAGLAAQACQRLRQLAGAQFGVAPGVAVQVAFDALADDFGVAGMTRGMRDQG